MLLEINEIVHVVVRRIFENDLRRHFIGEIKAFNDSIARIEGFFMIFGKGKNTFVKKPHMRVTIMDLSSSGYPAILVKSFGLQRMEAGSLPQRAGRILAG